MGWGGAREGAGRPKVDIPKKYRGIRLTDDEWAFVKEAVKKYRNGETVEAEAPKASSTPKQTQQMVHAIVYQGYSGAGLLAHLEELYQQEYDWLQEYKKYLKSDHYDKHSLEEINLRRELIRLQIVALIPHLNHFNFDYNVKLACSQKGKAHISASQIPDIDKDIEINAWMEPDGLDYDEENLKLARIYRDLKKEWESVRELERHQNDW